MTLVQAIDNLLAYVENHYKTPDYGNRMAEFDALDRAVYVEGRRFALQDTDFPRKDATFHDDEMVFFGRMNVPGVWSVKSDSPVTLTLMATQGWKADMLALRALATTEGGVNSEGSAVLRSRPGGPVSAQNQPAEQLALQEFLAVSHAAHTWPAICKTLNDYAFSTGDRETFITQVRALDASTGPASATMNGNRSAFVPPNAQPVSFGKIVGSSAHAVALTLAQRMVMAVWNSITFEPRYDRAPILGTAGPFNPDELRVDSKWDRVCPAVAKFWAGTVGDDNVDRLAALIEIERARIVGIAAQKVTPERSHIGEGIEQTIDQTNRARASESGEFPQYIRLDQAAALVNRSKRTLEKHKAKGKMPRPAIEGGGGKPDEWDYSVLKPWLEGEFGRKLPDRFPASR